MVTSKVSLEYKIQVATLCTLLNAFSIIITIIIIMASSMWMEHT
jgi:hypothetical protein